MIFPFRSLPVAGFRGISILVASVAMLALPAQARPRAAHKEVSNSVAYKGAIVIDAASGKVLVEDRADEVSPPASMTKLMTYAVLWDKLNAGAITLDTEVKIDRSDSGMGGTQVYLDPRETFPVEDLIYAMMIQSANDAAHALARVSAGSVEAFVELMNAKARELGMTHTTFRSPHGLPPASRRIADGDLTTPRDYALLCRYLLLHTDVLKYTSVRNRVFAPKRTVGNPVQMKNHNTLLDRVAGVDGLKTGYTKGAGYCLSATAERNGRRVILVIMGSLGPGGTVDLGRTRDIKAIELIERGFSEFPAGGPDFDTERAKYVKPSVIPLDNSAAGVPATSALPAAPATSSAATAPAADTPSSGPVIKLNLPHS